MKHADFESMELVVGRARIVLSLVVLLSIWVDPTTGGFFGIGNRMLTILMLHLAYGLGTYWIVSRKALSRLSLWITAGLDVVFAGGLALCTEGPTRPSVALFMFAIIAAGCWADMPSILMTTLTSVLVYLYAIAVSGHGLTNPYLMRAVYLAIAAYLIGFIGHQRDKFEARLHKLHADAERRAIARSLHDGCIQALAGFNLRLESCRDMLANNFVGDALAEIEEMQTGVVREYDEVRNYVHDLVGLNKPAVSDRAEFNTQFRIQASFDARAQMLEHVLHIVLEVVRNTHRHGRAFSASINIGEVDNAVRITIDDDGVGFGDATTPPWTIASRVAEFGGRLAVTQDYQGGAHLEMEIPKA